MSFIFILIILPSISSAMLIDTCLKSNGNVEFPWPVQTLPTNIMPLHYNLNIHPDLFLGTFSGTVTIDIKVKEKSNWLILHAKCISISKIVLSNGSKSVKKELKKRDVQFQYSNDQLALRIPKLIGNKFRINFIFNGTMNKDQTKGLFVGNYTSRNMTKYIAFSSFHPIHARRMMPCFDEPLFKATFQVTITRHSSMRSLSNRPLIETRDMKNNLLADVYAFTPLMSTYLLAIAVYDQETFTSWSLMVGSIKVSIYSKLDEAEKAADLLSFAGKTLEYLNGFFHGSYDMKELDLLCTPCPSSPYDSESWGLITAQCSIMFEKMYLEQGSLQYTKYDIIAHNLVHQWIGNLVTMKAWDDMWLKEGMTMVVESLIRRNVHTNWDVMSLQHNVEQIMEIDCRENDVSIISAEFLNSQKSDNDEIYPSVYAKIAAVLNLLYVVVGGGRFQSLIADYVHNFQYLCVNVADFINFFGLRMSDKSRGMDIGQYLTDFIDKPGFPLIDVYFNNGTITFKQQKYYDTAERFEEAAIEEELWHLPITMITDKNSQATVFWLDKKEQSFLIDNDIQWYKINVNKTGYYRVFYSDNNLAYLTRQLVTNSNALSREDKADLLCDMAALFKVGIFSFEAFFNVLRSNYLDTESFPPVWKAVGYISNKISQIIFGTKLYSAFKGMMAKALEIPYKNHRLNMKLEGQEALSQPFILLLACSYNVSDCRESTVQLFMELLVPNFQLEDFSPTAKRLCSFAVQVSEDVKDSLWLRFIEEKAFSEKLDVAMCFATRSNFNNLSAALLPEENSTNPSHIYAIVDNLLTYHMNGLSIALEWIEQKMSKFHTRCKNDSFVTSQLVELFSISGVKADMKKVRDLFGSCDHVVADVNKTVESIRTNVRSKRRQRKDIERVFKTYGYIL